MQAGSRVARDVRRVDAAVKSSLGRAEYMGWERGSQHARFLEGNPTRDDARSRENTVGQAAHPEGGCTGWCDFKASCAATSPAGGESGTRVRRETAVARPPLGEDTRQRRGDEHSNSGYTTKPDPLLTPALSTWWHSAPDAGCQNHGAKNPLASSELWGAFCPSSGVAPPGWRREHPHMLNLHPRSREPGRSRTPAQPRIDAHRSISLHGAYSSRLRPHARASRRPGKKGRWRKHQI